MKLPARGIWQKDAKKENPVAVLIVQAEMGPDGEVMYGIIEAHAIRSVAAREFARLVE